MKSHVIEVLFMIASGCLPVCGRLRRPPIEAHSPSECLSRIARFDALAPCRVKRWDLVSRAKQMQRTSAIHRDGRKLKSV